MGFFTDAYDLFVIGVAATMIVSEWHIASYQTSLLSSLALLTSAAGAVFFGPIADRFGRRKVYGYEVLVLAGGAVASAFAPGIWWLIAFRDPGVRHRRGLPGQRDDHERVRGAPPPGADGRAGVLDAGRRARGRAAGRHRPAEHGHQPGPHLADHARAREATGFRGVLAERRLLRWLIGASLAWLLFDFAYYGNTISSPLIVKLAGPHASLLGTTTWTLAIFAVAEGGSTRRHLSCRSAAERDLGQVPPRQGIRAEDIPGQPGDPGAGRARLRPSGGVGQVVVPLRRARPGRR
jgi:hypothetical protein